jgi:transcriptional regulator with XRE-family HTH domain
MVAVPAPAVRAEFAKRLRALRAQRGYERARHFAKALGIEENRYTRYERAEVEPNLTLLVEICQKLAVTPNELMGFPDGMDAAHAASLGDGPVAERPQARRAPEANAGPDLRALAWQLATEAAQVQAELRGLAKAAFDPLRLVRDTGRLYSRLEQDPFGTVAEIVEDPALQEVTGERKVKLAALIAAYTEGVSEEA